MKQKESEDLIEIEGHQRVSVSRIGSCIYFFDEIDTNSVCEAIKYIDMLELENTKNITIVLNSIGGDIYSGLALYDRIRSSECRVTIIGTGLIASMAFIIFLAGDRRVMTKYARFMNHKGVAELAGNPENLKKETKEIDDLENICLDIIVERTKQDSKTIKNSIRDGNKYIYAEEALKTGIVHEIISEIKKGKT